MAATSSGTCHNVGGRSGWGPESTPAGTPISRDVGFPSYGWAPVSTHLGTLDFIAGKENVAHLADVPLPDQIVAYWSRVAATVRL